MSMVFNSVIYNYYEDPPSLLHIDFRLYRNEDEVRKGYLVHKTLSTVKHIERF